MKIPTLITLIIILTTTVAGCAIPTDLFPPGGSSDTSTTTSGTSMVRDVRMCTEPDDKQCADDQSVFDPGDPSISLTAEVTNVTEGMVIIFTWKYLGGDPEVQPFTVGVTEAAAEQSEAVRPVVSTIDKIDPNKDWASGDYVVEIELVTPGAETMTQPFKVR